MTADLGCANTVPSLLTSWHQCGRAISMCCPVASLGFIQVLSVVTTVACVQRPFAGRWCSCHPLHKVMRWNELRDKGNLKFTWHIKKLNRAIKDNCIFPLKATQVNSSKRKASTQKRICLLQSIKLSKSFSSMKDICTLMSIFLAPHVMFCLNQMYGFLCVKSHLNTWPWQIGIQNLFHLPCRNKWSPRVGQRQVYKESLFLYAACVWVNTIFVHCICLSVRKKANSAPHCFWYSFFQRKCLTLKNILK